MIFDGRPLDQVANSEIAALVGSHEREARSLEFKALVKHKTDEERLEALRDISSFANAAGGYLIIGIGDDGKGGACGFSGLSIEDAEKTRKSVVSLARVHIQETLDDITSSVRSIDKANHVLLLRIGSSARKPHMITYSNHTEFWTRYDDGKRPMSIPEIREAFFQDRLERQMADVQAALLDIQERSASGVPVPGSGSRRSLLDISDGAKLADAALADFEEGLP